MTPPPPHRGGQRHTAIILALAVSLSRRPDTHQRPRRHTMRRLIDGLALEDGFCRRRSHVWGRHCCGFHDGPRVGQLPPVDGHSVLCSIVSEYTSIDIGCDASRGYKNGLVVVVCCGRCQRCQPCKGNITPTPPSISKPRACLLPTRASVAPRVTPVLKTLEKHDCFGWLAAGRHRLAETQWVWTWQSRGRQYLHAAACYSLVPSVVMIQ